jgi:SAM-dependent methyltransferase
MQTHIEGQEFIPRCGLCGSKETERLFAAEDHIFGHAFWLVKCKGCSFVYTNPRPTHENLAQYYPNRYYGTDGLRFRFGLENVVHFFRKWLATRIERRFDHPGKVLEVGSGRGSLLQELHLRRWQAVGTEYSADISISTSKHMGIDIILSSDLLDCEFPDNHFDLIICYHVLEHLPDPIVTIAEMRRILQPHGILILAVPNFGGWVSQWTKKHWFAIDVPRHLSHFTPLTIEEALSSTGFATLQKRTLSFEQDVFGFAQSIMNKAGFQYNLFYDLIRRQNARLSLKSINWQGSTIKLVLIALFGIFLCLVGLPIVIVAALFRKGGTLEYWVSPTHPIVESSKH